MRRQGIEPVTSWIAAITGGYVVCSLAPQLAAILSRPVGPSRPASGTNRRGDSLAIAGLP
jgi:hypothetical protein